MDLSVIIPIYHGRKYIPSLLKMLDENISNAKDI